MAPGKGAYLLDACPCSQKRLLAQLGGLLVQLLPGLQHGPKLLVGAELQWATPGLLGARLHLQLLPHAGRPGGVVPHLDPREMEGELGWVAENWALRHNHSLPGSTHARTGAAQAVPGQTLDEAREACGHLDPPLSSNPVLPGH